MLRVIFVAVEDFEDFEGVTRLSSQEFWSGCKYKQRLSTKNVIISDTRTEEKKEKLRIKHESEMAEMLKGFSPQPFVSNQTNNVNDSHFDEE